MDWFEFIDLPQLQSVYLGNAAFYIVHSIVFESDGMDGLMIQICLNYNQLHLVIGHSLVFIRLCLRVVEWMD